MNKNLDKILLDLKARVNAYSLPVGIEIIPEYATIKASQETMFTSYSSAVTAYNKLCDSLSKLQYLSVSIDRLLRELPNSGEVFSRQKFFNTELGYLKSDCRAIIDSYRALKEGVESAVRFYNSTQYLLNTYRLDA